MYNWISRKKLGVREDFSAWSSCDTVTDLIDNPLIAKIHTVYESGCIGQISFCGYESSLSNVSHFHHFHFHWLGIESCRASNDYQPINWTESTYLKINTDTCENFTIFYLL